MKEMMFGTLDLSALGGIANNTHISLTANSYCVESDVDAAQAAHGAMAGALGRHAAYPRLRRSVPAAKPSLGGLDGLKDGFNAESTASEEGPRTTDHMYTPQYLILW